MRALPFRDRLVGAAARPRQPWRPNPLGTPARTLEQALAVARDNGVDFSDEDFVFSVSPRPLGANLHAAYLDYDAPRRDSVVEVGRLLTEDGRIGVVLCPTVLERDDAIIAVVAHEVFEARALLDEFRKSGGRMPAWKVRSLVDSVTGTLHCAAWDHADELVRKRHG